MIHSFTRIASLVLAFGFFISCNTFKSTTTNPNQDVQKLSVSQLEKKIADIDQQLSAGDSTAILLYQKGQYLTKLAQEKDAPTERTPLYRDARHNLIEAGKHSDESSSSIQEDAQELLNVSWSNEHNQGVQIMQSDSALDNSGYVQAATHFSNATTIIPDSAISYKMGARAYYQSQQPDKAITFLESARNNITNPPTVLLEQLAYLYLDQENPQQAIAVYEEAESFSKQNLNLLHGLSNAYISAGEHEKSIELLQTLVEEKPENILYKESLATELYYSASKKISSYVRELQSGSPNIDLPTIDSLFTRAEANFSELADQNPENIEIKTRLAQFYHNSASHYQQLLPLLDSSQQPNIENKIEDYLTSSLPLLQELAKKNPEQKVFWKNLYQAYSYLGMQEEARKVKSNF